jgi:hypothetical protein
MPGTHSFHTTFCCQRCIAFLVPGTQVLYDDDIHALTCSRDKSFLCWDLRVCRACEHAVAHVRRPLSLHASLFLQHRLLVLLNPCTQREKRVSSHTVSSGISAIALTPDQSLVITAGQDKKLTYVLSRTARLLVHLFVRTFDSRSSLLFCHIQVLGLKGNGRRTSYRSCARQWGSHVSCGPL